jgi:hypothetical protein
VCFALSYVGIEGAGGGFYRRVVCEVVLGCGVAVTEQMTRGSRCDGEGGSVAGCNGDGCAAKGGRGVAVVRCKGGVVVRMEAGTRAGARVSGGVDDPDVCGLWFQESLPLCMVITPSVLFFYLL